MRRMLLRPAGALTKRVLGAARIARPPRSTHASLARWISSTPPPFKRNSSPISTTDRETALHQLNATHLGRYVVQKQKYMSVDDYLSLSPEAQIYLLKYYFPKYDNEGTLKSCMREMLRDRIFKTGQLSIKDLAHFTPDMQVSILKLFILHSEEITWFLKEGIFTLDDLAPIGQSVTFLAFHLKADFGDKRALELLKDKYTKLLSDFTKVNQCDNLADLNKLVRSKTVTFLPLYNSIGNPILSASINEFLETSNWINLHDKKLSPFFSEWCGDKFKCYTAPMRLFISSLLYRCGNIQAAIDKGHLKLHHASKLFGIINLNSAEEMRDLFSPLLVEQVLDSGKLSIDRSLDEYNHGMFGCWVKWFVKVSHVFAGQHAKEAISKHDLSVDAVLDLRDFEKLKNLADILKTHATPQSLSWIEFIALGGKEQQNHIQALRTEVDLSMFTHKTGC